MTFRVVAMFDIVGGTRREEELNVPQCANAFTPLYALIPAGSVIVKSTSYMTVPGRMPASLLVVLTPSTVSPRIGVISLPAYVVGMHICGRPVRMEIALPRPIVLPPPMEITASAFVSSA
jgi:hypothetical protein